MTGAAGLVVHCLTLLQIRRRNRHRPRRPCLRHRHRRPRRHQHNSIRGVSGLA